MIDTETDQTPDVRSQYVRDGFVVLPDLLSRRGRCPHR